MHGSMANEVSVQSDRFLSFLASLTLSHRGLFEFVLPSLCLVSSICFVLAQDLLALKYRYRQVDVRNKQLSDMGAAFRYRLSGLITGFLLVQFHLLVLLWLYNAITPGLVHQIILVFLSLLSLVLYHNAKCMHRKCLCGHRAMLVIGLLVRTGSSITLVWSEKATHVPHIIDAMTTGTLAILIIISRDVLEDEKRRLQFCRDSSVNTPLLPISSIHVPSPFQMGNPLAYNLISRVSYLFVGRLIQNADNFTSLRNLPSLGTEETSQFNVDEYEKLGSTNFLWKVWVFIAPVLMMSGFLELFQSCLNFMQPLFINRLLVYLGEIQKEYSSAGSSARYSESHVKAMICVMLLTTSACSIPLFISMYFNMQFRLAIRLRSLLICLIYRKLMRLPMKARRKERSENRAEARLEQLDFPSGASTPRAIDLSTKDGEEDLGTTEDAPVTSPGQVVNMISSDVARVEWATMAIHNCWSAVLQLILPIYLLYCQVGWPAFTVLAVMVIGIPLANMVFKYQMRNASEIMRWKDQRLALTREVFSNIKCVKLFAWESELKKRIFDLRERELVNLWKMRVGEFLNNTLWNGLPIVMSLSVFGCCATAAIDRDLTVQQLLTAFAIINMIAFPLSFLPLVTAAFSEGITTLWRLKAFLSLPEMKNTNRIHTRSVQSSPYSVVCEKMDFCWAPQQYILKNVSFKFRHGIHLAIVGPTGSGKSTLVEMLVGNLNPTYGHLGVYGRISYCAQTAWLQAGTIQSNILFGATMETDRYHAACEAAALAVDFNDLEEGDLTKVGDRGCTLSGGQKHRIALARALYRESDCYIFDDVLSAVDHKVARQICAGVFGSFLKTKTVILVTHRSEALEYMDYVLCLGKGLCTLHSASDRKSLPGWFDDVQLHGSRSPEHERRPLYSVPRLLPASPLAHMPTIEPPREDTGNMIEDDNCDATHGQTEKVEVHTIPWQTYLDYFEACGGFTSVMVLVTMAAASQGFSVFSNWFLSRWAAAWQAMQTSDRLESLTLFCASNAMALILLAGGSLLAAFLAQRASRLLHCDLVKRLLSATLAFIEGTSQGSILNRLSQDIQILDERLPQSLMAVLQETLKVLGIFFITVAALPAAVVLILPLSWIYRRLLEQFVRLSRQMQRLDASLRAPLVGIFSESVEGIATIRAFGVVPNFILSQQKRLDNHLRASYLTLLMNRWSAIKLEMMGAAVICSVGLLCVWNVYYLSVATMGLALSYCMMLSGTLAWLVRVHGDKENNIVSVDRLTAYIESPQEELPGEEESDFCHDLALHWPPAGAIHFQEVSVRYGESSEPALQNVNLRIEPGQKVAFLGRTGAGKSTLLNCLFRLSPFEGRVFIDGVDITNVPLRRLRSSLAVIPQDPITLSGTIRDNLDPFHEHADVKIHEVLGLVRMCAIVESLPQGIYTSLSDGKFQFSAGQRQLLCLARVLLRNVRILVLDEATSSVDPVTDALMQELIRSHFVLCTVLTIAHRVSTILDYDLIVGLQNGKVVETGDPKELLVDRESLLSSLYRASQQNNQP